MLDPTFGSGSAVRAAEIIQGEAQPDMGFRLGLWPVSVIGT